MILTVSFRNHRGVDVGIPQDLVRPGTPPSLREGFSIHLFREPDRKAGQPARAPERSNTGEEPWSEIRPARAPVHHESKAARTLGPTESAEVLKVDLGDFFLISKPGNYRVEMRSESLRCEDGKPGVLAGSFALAL